METIEQSQIKKISIDESLFLASFVMMDVSRTIRDIQTIVAVTVRYVMIGVSIINNVIGLFQQESMQLE